MSYPSIITQPGAAQRNVEPITAALSELLDVDQYPDESTDRSSDSYKRPRRILEIGSGDCTHIRHWAERWEGVEWWPTGRNEGEVQTIDDTIKQTASASESANVRMGLQLDIGLEESWTEFGAQLSSFVEDDVNTSSDDGVFDGIVMINVIHCCPVDYPENVFRHFSPSKPRPLLKTDGWIAAYSPFLADDGSYKSEGDEKFDREYIKSKDDSLGLRTIPSVSAMAQRHGFREVVRREMPKGNMWVVWSAA